MHERLLQTVENGEREGAALGFIIQGYWFPSTSYHQPIQRHRRPWVREKEGLSDGDGTRARLTGGCSLLRASYLSFFPFLRPSTFLLPVCCVNLHTDWHLFKPSCSLMTSLHLIISVRCLWCLDLIRLSIGHYFDMINFEVENGNPRTSNACIFYFKYVGFVHENEI